MCHTCSVTLPLILECGTETYHFPAECRIFQEFPYAKNHISKTLCSVLLRNRSQLGQTHDECPTYRTLYVSSCNIKITFSYISSWCHACSMVHGDYHFTQGTICSVCCWSPSLLQLSYTVPTEAGLLWHNVDILGETIKGTPCRLWGTVLCSQYSHSDYRSVEFYHQSLREHIAAIYRSERAQTNVQWNFSAQWHDHMLKPRTPQPDITVLQETVTGISGSKSWNGPEIQVRTLNRLHVDNFGCKWAK